MAAFFAARTEVPLTVTLVRPLSDGPDLPMAFDIAMAPRKDDSELRSEVDAALKRRRADVDSILNEYHVPRVDQPPEAKR